MISILIADDQTLTREGSAAVLAAVKGFNIIGAVQNQTELDKVIIECKPDVVITSNIEKFNIQNLDIDLSKILLFFNSQDQNDINRSLAFGIKNFLSKTCSSKELIDAVSATAGGEQYFCKQTLAILSSKNSSINDLADIPNLSAREIEIIKLIAEGLTNNEISEKLFISIHTTKTHRKNILKKLGFKFKNSAELIAQLNILR